MGSAVTPQGEYRKIAFPSLQLEERSVAPTTQEGRPMARTRAIANGPVDFTDPNGKQISLPLTAVFFDGNAVKAEGDLYNANKAIADPWLAYLAKNRLLVPDANPPTKTAMVVKARDPGSSGNFIQIEFTNFD